MQAKDSKTKVLQFPATRHTVVVVVVKDVAVDMEARGLEAPNIQRESIASQV